MVERVVPGLTFEQVQSTAKKPGGVSSERWQIGMAVVGELMQIGEPINVIPDSVVGPDMPNKYKVSGADVEFMPQWRYATVDGEDTRTHVLFSTFSATGDPQRPIAGEDLPSSEIITNIKTAIIAAASKVGQ